MSHNLSVIMDGLKFFRHVTLSQKWLNILNLDKRLIRILLEYKAKIFDALYHKRWDIEELYKISKEHFGIEEMHAKTDRGVKQEIYAHTVLINIARLLELSEDKLDDNKKVNFTTLKF